MPRSMKRKASLPTKEKIREFWLPKLEELGKIDFDSSEKDCFCCGRNRVLERAHIFAEHLGGPSTVDNLHLLCKACHIESEPYHADLYWDWFKSKCILEESDRDFIDRHKMIELTLSRLKEKYKEVDFTTLSSQEIVDLMFADMRGEKICA